MEAYYNFLDKYLMNKFLTLKGEASGLIPYESFAIRKGYTAEEVALCRQIYGID